MGLYFWEIHFFLALSWTFAILNFVWIAWLEFMTLLQPHIFYKRFQSYYCNLILVNSRETKQHFERSFIFSEVVSKVSEVHNICLFSRIQGIDNYFSYPCLDQMAFFLFLYFEPISFLQMNRRETRRCAKGISGHRRNHLLLVLFLYRCFTL